MPRLPARPGSIPEAISPVPDVPPAPDVVAALRAANARLREVIGARDAEVVVLRAHLEACQAQLVELRAGVEALRPAGAEPAELIEAAVSRGAGRAGAQVAAGQERAQAGPSGGPARGGAGAGRPDEVVTHEPGWCAGCGTGLFGAEVTGTGCRQVIGLPEVIRVLVTEHRTVSRRCGCGAVTSGTAPAGVSAPVRYGPRLPAAAVYLWHGQFLSRGRTCEAISELSGVTVPPGVVTGMVTRVAGAVSGWLEVIRRALAAAGVAHFGETGFRVAGRLAWVHSASSGRFALITVHPRRGRQAMDAAGVLPAFTGIAVHDCRAPCDGYGQVAHALCNAHALRELRAVTDAARPASGAGPRRPRTPCGI